MVLWPPPRAPGVRVKPEALRPPCKSPAASLQLWAQLWATPGRIGTTVIQASSLGLLSQRRSEWGPACPSRRREEAGFLKQPLSLPSREVREAQGVVDPGWSDLGIGLAGKMGNFVPAFQTPRFRTLTLQTVVISPGLHSPESCRPPPRK